MSAVWIADLRSALHHLEQPDPEWLDPRWAPDSLVPAEGSVLERLAAASGEAPELLAARLGRKEAWPARARGPDLAGELEIPAIPDDPRERLLRASTYQGWPKVYKLAVQAGLAPASDEKVGNAIGMYAWGANDPIARDPAVRLVRERRAMSALADVVQAAERLERQPLSVGLRAWLDDLHEAAVSQLAAMLRAEARRPWVPSSVRTPSELWSSLRLDHQAAVAAGAILPEDGADTLEGASSALRAFARAFVDHVEAGGGAEDVVVAGGRALGALEAHRGQIIRSVRYRSRALELERLVRDRMAAVRGGRDPWALEATPDQRTAEGWRRTARALLEQGWFTRADLRALLPHALDELWSARAEYLALVTGEACDPQGPITAVVTVRGLEQRGTAPLVRRMADAATLSAGLFRELAASAVDPALGRFLEEHATACVAAGLPPEPTPIDVQIKLG